MPEPLIARSALRSHVAPEISSSAPAVTLRERSDLALAYVSALKGREAELAEAVRSTFGLELPTKPKRVAAGDNAFVWAGPGKWLATSTSAADFSALPGAVADQSDGRSVVSISGEKARETLATLIAIDLHPRAFSTGDAALTHAASISVHLWQTDDAPTYEIAVFRSYAATLWRWLVHAGQSRGIDAKL